MIWPFLQLNGQSHYAPIANFGVINIQEGSLIAGCPVIADPITAHTELHNHDDIKHNIVVIERGICSFAQKVLRAQEAGATAVIITNNDTKNPSHAFVMCPGSADLVSRQSATIRIPAIMIPYVTAKILYNRIRDSYLDRTDYELTIMFLAASQAAAQLEYAQANDKLGCYREKHSLRTNKCVQDLAALLRERASLSSGIEDVSVESAFNHASSFSSPDQLSMSISTQSSSPIYTGSPARSCILPFHSDSSTKLCLLIMDMQNYFIHYEGNGCSLFRSLKEPERYRQKNDSITLQIDKVLETARLRENVEIVYSIIECLTFDGRDRSNGHKATNLIVKKSSYEAKIIDKLASRENEIVLQRTGDNVFGCTNIDYVLRNMGISHIVLMGISVMRSIDLCARMATDKGYRVTMLKECINFHLEQDGFDTEASLLRSLETIGVHISSTTPFIKDLSECPSPHPPNFLMQSFENDRRSDAVDTSSS